MQAVWKGGHPLIISGRNVQYDVSRIDMRQIVLFTRGVCVTKSTHNTTSRGVRPCEDVRPSDTWQLLECFALSSDTRQNVHLA